MAERKDDARATPPRWERVNGTTLLLVGIVVLVLVLRHDYWWWDDARPLLFGFLPVGLWWQALVTLLAAGMMWVLVRFAWPAHLETSDESGVTSDE